MRERLYPIRVFLCVLFCLVPVTAQAQGTLLAEALSGIQTQYTTYSEALTFLAQLDQNSPRIKVYSLGTSAGGYQIPVVALSDPVAPADTWRVLLMARQHGNEPAGMEALLHFAKFGAYSQNPEWLAILRTTRFILLPVVNPDGAIANRRVNSRGVDLNRDWETLRQPETRAVEQLVASWRPHVLVDMHEVPPGNRYPEPFIECLRENHSTSYSYVREVQSEQAVVLSCLRTNGFQVANYTASDALDEGLAHRHFGLKYGIRSFLFESKRYADARGSLQNRIKFHITGLLALVIAVLNEHALPASRAPYAPLQPAIIPAQDLPVMPASVAGPQAQPVPAQPALAVTLSGLISNEVLRKRSQVVWQVRPALAERQFVKVELDGNVHNLTNAASGKLWLDPATLTEGAHELKVSIVDSHGYVLASTERDFGTLPPASNEDSR